MEVAGRKVLVFGAGISGIGAVRLLKGQKADVILYDGNEQLDTGKVKEKLGEYKDIQIVAGAFPEEELDSLQLVVLSPGVPTDLPVIKRMHEKNIPVVGEVELAYEYGKGDVLAITGTNGKTTTTTLLGEIMKDYRGEEVFVVGNIGNPYTVAAGQMKGSSVAVAEMSSFQLESIKDFRPKVSAILNYTPDHLNRHHTMEAYIAAKENIARNQREGDFCILNYEEKIMREFAKNLKCQVLYFSSRRKLEKGIYLEDGNIIYHNDRKICICGVDELNLLGTHNYENVMAAAAMALVLSLIHI